MDTNELPYKTDSQNNLWLLGREEEGIVRKFGITALLISYLCVLLAWLCPTLCKSMEENKETNVVGFLLCARYAAAAKSLQSCPILRPHRQQPIRLPQPWDFPGKNAGVGCHFLLQCVKVKVKSLSHVQLLVTPWTAASQAPPSMGFSWRGYWSGVPLPSPVPGML